MIAMGTIFLTCDKNNQVKITIVIGRMVEKMVCERDTALIEADKRYEEMMNGKKIAEKL